MQNDGLRVISMDANFGLVRKHSGGHALAPPNHDGLFFVQQDVVDQCLEYLPSGFANKSSNVIILFEIVCICKFEIIQWNVMLIGFQKFCPRNRG